MPDTLGRITVPTPVSSGQTWSLVSDWPAAMDWEWDIITHRFQSLATLATQRYFVGTGPRRFHWRKSTLTFTERATLLAFYNSMQGSYKSFIYPAPNSDRATFTNFTVIFDTPPISFDDLASMCRAGFTFLETDPASSPSYSISSTVAFPFTSAMTGLLDQVQQIIPLVHIQVRNPAVDHIYLSDRRVTVGGQLYLPRVLGIGDPTSDILYTQSLDGRADNVSFSLGNADRVMSALVADCSLKYASIDLCLFHVNSTKLLQLWKGIITSWSFDGGAEFRLQCSDGLYPITQTYPRRSLTRECWKPFDDGINCPYTSQHTVSVPGPTDATTCDYHFNTPNGCLAHGMSPYFGGHPSFPQNVVIKDNGTGTIGGLGRKTVTSTSIVSDSIWGTPLPEIWCNDDGNPLYAFQANCIVAAVRGEADFEDVLGVIGAGPIGQFAVNDPRPGGNVTSVVRGIPSPPGEGGKLANNSDGVPVLIAPLADNIASQGFKVDLTQPGQLGDPTKNNDLGLRQIHGSDPVAKVWDGYALALRYGPAAFSLGQGSPQRWDIPDPTFSNLDTGQLNNVIPLAAGTAFCDIRYPKVPDKGGIVPTTVESHSMTVPISKGLTGFTFDTSDNRVSVPGLTNPFWVAVNTYFRALGIDKADAATQLASFIRSSLISGTGSGCAEIADLPIAPLIGDPTALETQFRFQGSITGPKPFRDWLVEILNCCLGYFTFEFGRLKLGTRNDASVTSTFTAGNMLYQSLTVSPVDAAFEYLRVEFANRDLQYQMDRATYEDKDHSAYFGRNGAPLTSSMRSVGLSSMSQALRVCATRVREEIGGVYQSGYANPYLEWDSNNRVSFRTTLLALDTSVGQVVSVTHPDLPTYPGLTAHTWQYRIERWSLHRDYSISITARSVTDAIYDLTVGPKPADLSPLPLPALFRSIPLAPVWAPYEVQRPANDALFPSEWTFTSDQQYTTLADGSAEVVTVVTGKLPVNTFAPGVGTPVIGSISHSTTGGSIPGGASWRVTVTAAGADSLQSPPAEIIVVQVPSGTNTNRIILGDLAWPKVAGLIGYTIYASDVDSRICGQQTGVLTDTGGAIYLPVSVSIPGPFARSTYSLPSPYVSKIRIKAKRLVHSGIVGIAVNSVASTNQLTAVGLIDVSGTPLDYTGRVLSVIGRNGSPTPPISFLISAFNPATGTLTTATTSVGGAANLSILPNDVIVIRCLGYDNSSTPTEFTDTGFENVTNAYVGMTVDAEIVNLVRVIAGLSRGEMRKIVSNTSDTLTFDLPLPLDSTSVLIVETVEYPYATDITAIGVANWVSPVSISIPTTNFSQQPLLIAGFTVDLNGVESPDGDNPIREDWVFGAPGIIGDGIIAYTDG